MLRLNHGGSAQRRRNSRTTDEWTWWRHLNANNKVCPPKFFSKLGPCIGVNFGHLMYKICIYCFFKALLVVLKVSCIFLVFGFFVGISFLIWSFLLITIPGNPDHTKNFVMVIITLKTILNETAGYHFCQVILDTIKSGSMYEIKNKALIMNIFIRSSRDPRKKGKRSHWGRDPRLTTTPLGDTFNST